MKNTFLKGPKIICLLPFVVLVGIILFSIFKTRCYYSLYDPVFLLSLGLALVVVSVLAFKFNECLSFWKIVIIGTLSLIMFSIVLSSLNASRSKGPDVSVKSALHNMRALAEIYYSNNDESYAGLCTSGGEFTELTDLVTSEKIKYDNKCKGWFWKLINPIEKEDSRNVSLSCSDSDEAYAVAAELPNRLPPNYESRYYCVDSRNLVGQAKDLTVTDYRCEFLNDN